MSDYASFLSCKQRVVKAAGFEVPELSDSLFPFQQAVARWALRMGRAAIFAGTGLGKTRMQVEWARRVVEREGCNALILAPLAVTHQTVAEAEAIGVTVRACKSQSDVQPGISITNYDRLDRFDATKFGAIVLDESSILKSYDGATRTQIIESFASTPYRLACTATPAPNDFMELGNHAEFLGVASRTEMLSTFFVHDGGETQKWRLKGHAEDDFWRWVASWAVMFRDPADLGFSDFRYTLPPLNMHAQVVDASSEAAGTLVPLQAYTLTERRNARTSTVSIRVAECAKIVAREPDEAWLIWCDRNEESSQLAKAIPGAVEVRGSDKPEDKERALLGFPAGKFGVLVSKPSICGFGMNWQHCARIAFVGLSDSFEQFYQAVRRCWRFGQTRPVECHVITSPFDGAVVANIARKERDAERLVDEMVRHMKVFNEAALRAPLRDEEAYAAGVAMRLPDWLEVAA